MKEDNKNKHTTKIDLSGGTTGDENPWDLTSAKHIYKDLFSNGSFQVIRNQLVDLCHGKNGFGDPKHFILLTSKAKAAFKNMLLIVNKHQDGRQKWHHPLWMARRSYCSKTLLYTSQKWRNDR